MILTETKREVSNTLPGESRQFTIKSNAKAFRILVDGLYSDKIGSIIRELTSNAFDAHVRRSNLDTPFEVRLPNSMNPNFSVRDYGCSMTHDEVFGLYSTLFESSKSAANDEVGAFGLGAKSFLAYTDACTVNCWLDGEMRAYLVALDEDGVPAVTLVHREDSRDHQGVEVTFAVGHQDFSAFQKAMSTAAYGYDKSPKVLGAELSVLEPIFTGKGWRMFKGMPGGHKVRQGCAVYPIGEHLYLNNIPYNYQMIVDVAIGDLDVTASRESISPTVAQKRAIEGQFQAAIREMNVQVQDQYNALNSPLEKAWFVQNNRELLGPGSWSTQVKIPLPLVQWKTESPYSQFNVDRIARIRLVMDDGTPIVRRKRRLVQLASQGDVYITDDPVTKAAAIKALGLTPAQVMNIGSIPDVPMPVRTGGPARPRKVVEPTRVWCFGERNKRNAGRFNWNANTDRLLNVGYNEAQTWFEGIVNATNPLGLLTLTQNEYDRAVKAGKISDKFRLDKVVEREVSKHAKQVEYSIIRDALVAGLHVTHVRQLMLEKSGYKPPATASHWMVQQYGVMFPNETEIMNRKGREKRSELAVKYPLLFGYDDLAVTSYITAMDELWANK